MMTKRDENATLCNEVNTKLLNLGGISLSYWDLLESAAHLTVDRLRSDMLQVYRPNYCCDM